MKQFLLFLLLAAFFTSFTQNKHDKKVRQLIANGYYKKAERRNIKYIAELTQKNDKLKLSFAHLNQAYIYYLMGELKTIWEKDLNIAQKYFSTSKPSLTDKIAFESQRANIYYAYGNLKKALEIVRNSEEIFGKQFDYEHSVLHRIAVKVYISCGYYNKAKNEVKDWHKYLLTTAPNSKDNYNFFKSLIEARHLLAEVLYASGDYFEALKEVRETKSYLLSHFNKNDVVYVDNQILEGKILVASEKYKDACVVLDKVFDHHMHKSSHGYSYKPTNPKYLEFIELSAWAHWYNNTNEGAKEAYNFIEPQIKRYYEDSSHHYSWINTLKGDKFYIQNNFKKALDIYEGEWDNYKSLAKNHPQRLALGLRMLKSYVETKQYAKAENLLATLSNIANTNLPQGSPIHVFYELKEAAFKTSYTSSEINYLTPVYDEGIKSLVEHGIFKGSPVLTDFLNEKAFFLIETNKFKKAEELSTQTTKSIKYIFGTDHYRYGQQLIASSNIDMSLGKPLEAYDKAQEAKKILENFKYKYIDRANAHRAYAKACIAIGSYKEAERNLNKAQTLLPYDERIDIDEYARLYIARGEYARVETILLENLIRKEKQFGQNNKKSLTIYNQLTQLYITLGDYSTADRYNRNSLELSQLLFTQESIQYTKAVKLKGDIQSSVGDYQSAISEYEKAYNLENKLYGDNNIISAQTGIKLSLSKFQNNEPVKTVKSEIYKFVTVILNSFEDDKFTPLVADVLTQQAIFQIEISAYDEAQENLKTANKIWLDYIKLKKGNQNSAKIYFLQGVITQKKKEYNQALKLYQKSSGMYKSIFGENHPDFVHTLTKIAQIQYILGLKKEALATTEQSTQLNLKLIQKYFPILSERAKTQFWNVHKSDFEFYNSLATENLKEKSQLIGKIYNNTLATKALLLSNSIKLKQSIFSSGDTSLIKKFRDYQELREKLAFTISNTQNIVSQNKLEKDIETLEKELSLLSDQFNSLKDQKAPTWIDVQESLKPNEVAIEIIRFRHFKQDFSDSIIYAALILDSETKKVPKIVILPNGKDLENKHLKFYRNAIQHRLKNASPYNQYWQAIDKYLKPGTNLYISSEGVYTQINIETFRKEDDYLLNKYQINLITSTKDLLDRDNQINQNNPAVLFANPRYYVANKDDHLSTNKEHPINQLIGAENEVISIATILDSNQVPNKTYVFDQAKEQELKELKSPRFLHIASHGYFINDSKSTEFDEIDESQALENPLLKSGILFADAGDIMANEAYYNYNKKDGVLTALEAVNLNLDQTDFVVLSACETGLGKIKNGEGVYGLQRALQIAGAKTVIMSLFKVDDQVTQKLMELFYSKYLTTFDKKSSFLYAKKELMKKYSAPYYWGAFILVE